MAGVGVLVAALLTAAVVGHCLVRCVIASRRSGAFPHVDLWHMLMGTTMIVMLLAPVGGRTALVGAVIFGIAAAWFLASTLGPDRPVRRPPDVRRRVAATSAVMAVMLVPAALGGPVPATPAMSDMTPRTTPPGSTTDASAMSMPPWLAAALLAVCAAVVVSAVRAGVAVAAETPRQRSAARLGSVCEVVMAGVMSYMAVLAL